MRSAIRTRALVRALLSAFVCAAGMAGATAPAPALAADDEGWEKDGIRFVVARDKPPPVEDPALVDFVKPRNFSDVRISPDGKHLAGLYFDGRGQGVIVIDIDTMKAKVIVLPAKVLGYGGDRFETPSGVHWIDANRVAVNFYGRDSQLFEIDGTPGRRLWAHHYLMYRDADGKQTDWAMVLRDYDRQQFARLNIATGEHQDFALGLPGRLEDWAYDAQGEIRVASTLDTSFWSAKSRVTTWYRSGPGAKWQEIDSRSVLDDVFDPQFVPATPGRVIVRARNGRDKSAIWSFDVEKKAFAEMMAGSDKEDLSGEIANDVRRDDLDRVWTLGLRQQVIWLDERMGQLQAMVDAALPGRQNDLSHVWAGRLLIRSSSDVDPGRWYVLDTTTKKMTEVVAAVRDLDPKKMQPMQTLRYPSADGLSIPAYLTLPGKPAGPVPLVVLVHGGPQSRNHWEFDDEVQMLAAHGYAVFQPQFRGSSGFGKHFREAGYGQWGLAMQDDISAGVKSLVDRGIADPGRICIVGGSYGGYAALWGLVKTPGLYRCGVSAFGVTDINRLLKDIDLKRFQQVSKEVNALWIGDPAHAEDFDAVSPLKHADRIKVPVLIAWGDRGPTIQTWHAEDMIAALKKAGTPVRGLEFKFGYHGFYFPDDQRVYFEELLRFLDQHIGAGAAKVAEAASR